MRRPIAVIISGSPVYHALGVVCGRPQPFDVTVDVLAVVADFKRDYCKAVRRATRRADSLNPPREKAKPAVLEQTGVI